MPHALYIAFSLTKIFDPRVGRIGPLYGAEYPDEDEEDANDGGHGGVGGGDGFGGGGGGMDGGAPGMAVQRRPPLWSGPGPPHQQTTQLDIPAQVSRQKVLKQLNSPCQKSMVSL